MSFPLDQKYRGFFVVDVVYIDVPFTEVCTKLKYLCLEKKKRETPKVLL